MDLVSANICLAETPAPESPATARGSGMSDPWRCAVCGRTYPVPSLARDCERKHETGYGRTNSGIA